MMALRLHEFVPIDDAIDRGCSLIDEVFGRDFYVEDESGRLLTPLRNQRLLRYARQIVGKADCRAVDLRREELSRLAQFADTVTPADYRRARDHDVVVAWQHGESDLAESAGAPEQHGTDYSARHNLRLTRQHPLPGHSLCAVQSRKIPVRTVMGISDENP